MSQSDTSSKFADHSVARSISALMMLLALAAFLPHRERALLLTDGGIETALLAEGLANTSFALPGNFSSNLMDRFWFGGHAGPASDPRRSRFGPGRALAAVVPGLIPRELAGAAGPSFPGSTGPRDPGSIPGAAPIFGSLPGDPGAGGSTPGSGGGGPGGFGPFPGGGAGPGGGGSIGGNIPTLPAPPPPTAAVPEPGVWAMLILGFGLIGWRVRRARRPVHYGT